MTHNTHLLRAVTLTLALTTTTPALAGQCGQYDEIKSVLTTSYQETRRAMGLVGQSTVMEVLVSPKGSWTIIATDTFGNACIVTTGENWQDEPVIVAGRDS